MKIYYSRRNAMKKSLLFLAALAVSSALCAQDNQLLGREDVLAAFKEYNPAALEKAATNPAYNDLLNKVVSAYSAPRTEERLNEMIALAMNFDNSILLQAAKEEYVEGRTLQAVSGEDMSALDKRVREDILKVVKSVFKNTLKVKDIQIDRYKEQIKAVKKDDSLSKQAKQEAVAQLNEQIKDVKAERKLLKKNSKQKIQDTALVYFAEIRSNYDKQQAAALLQAQAQESEASQAAVHDVKANNKKPVAK